MNIAMDVFGKSSSKFRLSSRRQLAGFTLIELVIVMVIVAIGVALAAPSFRAIIEKRKLTSATEDIAAFISFAQSEAIKRNQDVIVNMRRTDYDNWCIGITLGRTACDCTEEDESQANFCGIEGAAYRMDQADVAPNSDFELMHQMSLNGTATSNGSFSFDPIRGTLLNLETVNIQMHTHTKDDPSDDDSRQHQLEVNVLPTGRVSICTSTVKKLLLKQYPTCT